MAKKTTKKAAAKQVKQIKFTKSPTGRFNLGYSEGNVVDVQVLGQTKCDELVAADYATYIN